MTTNTTTASMHSVVTLRDAVLDLIGCTLTDDVTLSAADIDRLLDLATKVTVPTGSTFITEEEIPEVLGALEIAAQVHATCGNAIQSANYQAVYSDIANRATA